MNPTLSSVTRRIRPTSPSSYSLLLLVVAGVVVAQPAAPAAQAAASAKAVTPSLEAQLDAAAAQAGVPAARARMEIHVGRRLLAQGLADRAAEHFQSVVQLVPTHPGAWYLLSRAYLGSGRIAEGRDAAANSVDLLGKLDPKEQAAYDPAMFWLNLGIANGAAAQLDAADDAFAKAEKLAPRDPRIRLERGSLALRRGQDAQAVDELREALAIGGPHGVAERDLGTALMHVGDMDGARAAFEQAITLDASDVDAHYGLSSVYRAQGDAAKQDAELQVFQKLRDAADERKAKQGEVDALVRDGVSRMADEKYAEAEPLLRKALELPYVTTSGYQHARLLTDLAKTRASQGDATEAEALYVESLGVEPGAFTSSFEFGTLLAKQGRIEEAMPHFLAAVAANPFDHAAHLNLGLGWGLLGRLKDAQAEIEKATILEPDDMEIRQLLVDLHWAIGDHERARALAEAGGVKVPGGSESEAANPATGSAAAAPLVPGRLPKAKDAARAGWRE
jgi:tetratricopeptide (TPR) repeat protein